MAPMLRQGAQGDPIGNLHQALLEAGYAIEPAEAAASRFGSSTLAALRDFQARHTGPDGHALEDDGIAGPATLWALEHPGGGERLIVPGWRCAPSEARPALVAVLSLAVGELGASVRESPPGSNRGPRVDLYTAPELAIPWCAAFVSYCYRACEGGSPFGRRLSAMSLYVWGENRGRVIGDEEPLEPGDLFVTLRGNGHGHTGIVASILDGDRFCTVEGNAGNAVRGLIRKRSGVTAIVRPVG